MLQRSSSSTRDGIAASVLSGRADRFFDLSANSHNHTPMKLTELHSLLFAAALCTTVQAAPKVVIIWLDGATLRLVDEFTASGAIHPNEGLGLLRRLGFSARQNITITL